MRHSEVRDLLSPYLEGDLEAGERAHLERHVADCAACAADLRDQQEAIRMLRTLPPPEIPPGLAEAVMAGLRGGAAAPPPPAAGFGRLALPLAAGVAALAVLATFASLDRSAPDANGARVTAPPFFAGDAPSADDPYDPAGRPGASGLVAGADRDPGPTRDAELAALLADPAAFLDELQALDDAQREEALDDLARSAARSGDAAEAARLLGATPHPLAAATAARFAPAH